jgi:hypothetical protein
MTQLPGSGLPRRDSAVNDADPADAEQGTFCPQCGLVVPLSEDHCSRCGHAVYHTPSKVQRYGLLSGLGFIILAGLAIFNQPKSRGVPQDLVEGMIILCVSGAAIAFFMAVVDMVKRGGE